MRIVAGNCNTFLAAPDEKCDMRVATSLGVSELKNHDRRFLHRYRYDGKITREVSTAKADTRISLAYRVPAAHVATRSDPYRQPCDSRVTGVDIRT